MKENCAECKHHDVFWEGSGCNLLNHMEKCRFELRLRPCPFCGGEAVICIKDWDNRADEYKVACSACGVQQEDFTFDKYEAIEAWNRRVNDEVSS